MIAAVVGLVASLCCVAVTAPIVGMGILGWSHAREQRRVVQALDDARHAAATGPAPIWIDHDDDDEDDAS